jgi:hypothetical protein
MDGNEEFESAALRQAPPGAVLVGSSISSDGRFAAALTLLPSANDYPMDDVFIQMPEGWQIFYGGNGCGISWGSLGQNEGGGVLRYGDEAPESALVAIIEYEGVEHRVSVRHGHFLFVAWDTPYARDPVLVGFE